MNERIDSPQPHESTIQVKNLPYPNIFDRKDSSKITTEIQDDGHGDGEQSHPKPETDPIENIMGKLFSSLFCLISVAGFLSLCYIVQVKIITKILRF